MKNKILLVLAGACAILGGCANKTTKNESPKILVLYYSQTGATKTVAEILQTQLNADIAAIEAVEPYDGDYDATIARWLAERDSNKKVAIKPLTVDINQYETIFLGYPVWGGTYALPVKTFLEENALDGKTVVTFATFGSGGLGSSTAEVVAAQPAAKVIAGYGVRNARLQHAADEISRFLIENGYKEGQVEPLPAYSESRALTDEESQIFKAATDGYKYPLGEAVRVSTRTTPSAVDYKYEVNTFAPDGTPKTGIIYVTLPNQAGAKPEFTEVVR